MKEKVAFLTLLLVLLSGWGSPVALAAGGGDFTAQSADLAVVGQVGGQGYAVFVEGDYAYVGAGPTFAIYDLSTPSQPTRIAYTILPDKVLDVQVIGDRAYFVTETHFYLYDIADKEAPVEVGSCDIGTYYVQSLYVEGDYAYLSTWNVGLKTLSIADPAHPTVVNTDSASTGRKVFVSGGYAYVAGNFNGLYIFSLADPADPTYVATWEPDSSAAIYDVRVVGERAYVVGSDWLWVLDVSDPASPTLLGSNDQLDMASSLTISGNYAYVAGFFGDLFTLSIATPSAPALLSSNEFAGSQGNSLAVSGSMLYAANSAGLLIFSLANPAAPAFTGLAGRPGEADAIYVHGGYAYVITDTDESHDYVDVFSLDDPTDPTLVSSWSRDLWAITALHQEGNYLYAAYAHRESDSTSSFFDEVGVQVFSLADPAHPQAMGKAIVESGGLSTILSSIFAAGNYLYATHTDRIEIVSIADKAHPALRATYTAGVDEPIDIHVEGQYAYVIDRWDSTEDRPSRLKVLSLANPTAPALVGSYDTPKYAHAVFSVWPYAYIAESSGLLVVDVSTPSAPALRGIYDTPGEAEDLYVYGDYAFVADGTDGLRMISITDPDHPAELDFYDTGVSGGVFVDENFAYLSDRMSGLVVLSYETPTVSGQVMDAEGAPLGGIVISAGGSYSATTGSDGTYTMTLPVGDYTLTPQTAGYFWEPPTRTVRAAGTLTGQDFQGLNILKRGERSGSGFAVAYGERITYTVRVVMPQDGDYTFYDPIPTPTLYLTGTLDAPAGLGYDTAGEAITGPLTMTAGIPQIITFSVQVAITGTAANDPPVVNRACFYPQGTSCDAGQWSNEIRYPTYAHPVYLPLILRGS